MKKRNKRSKVKYPGLDKQYTLKIRQEVHDQDYIDKLSDKEKRWLNNFNEEYINANLKHKGKKLHKTKVLRQSINRINNNRNNDVYARTKRQGMLKGEKDIKSLLDRPINTASQHEDTIIELIDTFEILKNTKDTTND